MKADGRQKSTVYHRNRFAGIKKRGGRKMLNAIMTYVYDLAVGLTAS